MKKYYWISSKLQETLDSTDWSLEEWRVWDHTSTSLQECFNDLEWEVLYGEEFPAEWTWLIFSYENWNDAHNLEKEFRVVGERDYLEEV